MKYSIKQHIHESNLIENIDSSYEDNQSFKAWLFLKDIPFLTKDVLKELHRMVTVKNLEPEYQGKFRNELRVNVSVGGKIAPQWYLVEHLINNWLLDYENLDPIEAHIRYEKIHPWLDGNGRTGRLLLWYHERKLGLEPTLFLNKEKYEKYYPLFK